jgi:hypothetical protein
MSSNHKVQACSLRSLFQLQRAREFLEVVTPVLQDDDEDANRQFLYQSTVMMVQSFFEEYFRCVVAVGTFWKTPAVRVHLGECYQDRERFASMPAAEVEIYAQKRVSFDERAGRLKAIIGVLTGAPPFADVEAEEACLDFVAVRNIIAHRGGWPDDASAPTVRSPNVIVETSKIGHSRFYKLRIGRQFFGDGLGAIGRSIVALEGVLSVDPVYKLPR